MKYVMVLANFGLSIWWAGLLILFAMGRYQPDGITTVVLLTYVSLSMLRDALNKLVDLLDA